MKLTKESYISLAILSPIYLCFLWLNYDTYKGWLTILFLIIGLSIGFAVTKFIVKQFNFQGKTNTNIELISLVITLFLMQIIPDYLTQYFIKQNQRQTCGIVGQIHQSSWRGDTFLLKGHTNQFNILSHATLSVGDKVCVTYNPNEKWYGYAYVFKLDKQP